MINSFIFSKAAEDRAAVFHSFFAATVLNGRLVSFPRNLIVHQSGIFTGYFLSAFSAVLCGLAFPTVPFELPPKKSRIFNTIIDPLMPAIIVIGTTTIAHKFQFYFTSFYAQGIVLGVHSVIINAICDSPLKEKISENLYAHLLGKSHTLTIDHKEKIDQLTNMTFVIFNVGITCLLRNPIVGVTSAYLTSRVTKNIATNYLKVVKSRKHSV